DVRTGLNLTEQHDILAVDSLQPTHERLAVAHHDAERMPAKVLSQVRHRHTQPGCILARGGLAVEAAHGAARLIDVRRQELLAAHHEALRLEDGVGSRRLEQAQYARARV